MVARIAVLTTSVSVTPDQIAEATGIETTVLPWTENLEQDLANLAASNATLLVAQYHHSHHGLLVARGAVRGLGIDAVLVSSCQPGWYKEDRRIPQDSGEDCPIRLFSDSRGAAQQIAEYIREGGYATAVGLLNKEVERAEQNRQHRIQELERQLERAKTEGATAIEKAKTARDLCVGHSERITARQTGNEVVPASHRPELGEVTHPFPPGTYRIKSVSYYPSGAGSEDGGAAYPDCTDATVTIEPFGFARTQGLRMTTNKVDDLFRSRPVHDSNVNSTWEIKHVNPQGSGPAILYLKSGRSQLSCHLASNEAV